MNHIPSTLFGRNLSDNNDYSGTGLIVNYENSYNEAIRIIIKNE